MCSALISHPRFNGRRPTPVLSRRSLPRSTFSTLVTALLELCKYRRSPIAQGLTNGCVEVRVMPYRGRQAGIDDVIVVTTPISSRDIQSSNLHISPILLLKAISRTGFFFASHSCARTQFPVALHEAWQRRNGRDTHLVVLNLCNPREFGPTGKLPSILP